MFKKKKKKWKRKNSIPERVEEKILKRIQNDKKREKISNFKDEKRNGCKKFEKFSNF